MIFIEHQDTLHLILFALDLNVMKTGLCTNESIDCYFIKVNANRKIALKHLSVHNIIAHLKPWFNGKVPIWVELKCHTTCAYF